MKVRCLRCADNGRESIREFQGSEDAEFKGWNSLPPADPGKPYFWICPPCSGEVARALADVRISTWDLDDFVSFARRVIMDEYLEEPAAFQNGFDHYRDQLDEENSDAL